MDNKIEIVPADSISQEDLQWFRNAYPKHEVIGFLNETWPDNRETSRIILKAKPGYKDFTMYLTARDCGDHYIIARHDRYDRIDKITKKVTKDVQDR